GGGVVPKPSAGQGLRAILNSYDSPPRVLATRGESDSLDLILRHYARRGRIALSMVEPRGDGLFAADDLLAALEPGADLLVLSQVMFNSGQVLPELPSLIAAARERGARVLLDVYHSLGVFPVAVTALDVDFAVGGSYKYLRGGPGACFLYLHPRHLDGSLSTLDVGWFAKRDPFLYRRPEPAEFAAGGDAFMESTPAVLPWYQARAGQVFTLAVGADPLRAYSLAQQRRPVAPLAPPGGAGDGRHRGSRRVRRHRGRRCGCARRRAGAARRALRRAGNLPAPVPGPADDRGRARERRRAARRGARRRHGASRDALGNL